MICWFALAKNPERYSSGAVAGVHLDCRQPAARHALWLPGGRGPAGGLKVATEQTKQRSIPTRFRGPSAIPPSPLFTTNTSLPRFPDVSSECLRATTCLYTVTPDAKFIIDAFPDCENVMFASACSGHGFKHSAAIGEALALLGAGTAAGHRPVTLSGLDRFSGLENRDSCLSPNGVLGLRVRVAIRGAGVKTRCQFP